MFKCMTALAAALALAAILVSGPPGTVRAQPADAEDSAAEADKSDDVTPGRRDRLPETTQHCEFFRTIYDWYALDPYNLIVYFNNRNTPRHIELETPCYGIRFTDTIAFTDGLSFFRLGVGDGRLCAFGGDSVVVPFDGNLRQGHFCEIGAIHELTVEEADELKTKFKERYKNRGKKKSGD